MSPRSWKLPKEDASSNISAYFSSVNYKKDHYFLNFNETKDFEQTLSFIKSADILITNFKKGDDIKFGLDYATLKSINSQLIYASITGFGSNSDRVAYDLILQAETGFMSMNGTENSGPVKMPIALIDVLAGHQLKEGILLALINRSDNGGCLITVSLYDAAIASLANQASNYLMAGHIPKPIGSLHPNISPYGEIFNTADNQLVTFAIGSQKQFEKLMVYLELEEESISDKFKNNISRVENRVDLASIIGAKVETVKLNDLLDYCLTHFIPAAEIKNLKQVFSNESAQDLILSETVEGVKTQRVKTVAFKIQK